jgi:hypothetical protein
MPSESDHGPRNAFTSEFLSRLDEIAEPDGAHEADAAGPWTVRPVPYLGGTGFALLREWESLEAGDEPYAVFGQREVALLAAAILPATGRDPLYRLDTEPDADGFPLLGTAGQLAPAGAHQPATEDVAAGAEPPAGAGRAVRVARGQDPRGSLQPSGAVPRGSTSRAAPAGHLRDFDEGFVDALHLVAAVVRSPQSLALLLEAAGYVALEQVGRILHRRMN